MVETLLARLEAVAARLEAAEGLVTGAAPPAPPQPAPAPAPAAAEKPFLAAWAVLVAEQLEPLVASAAAVGDAGVEAATAAAARAFAEQGRVLEVVAACRRPDVSALQRVLAGCGAAIGEAQVGGPEARARRDPGPPVHRSGRRGGGGG